LSFGTDKKRLFGFLSEVDVHEGTQNYLFTTFLPSPLRERTSAMPIKALILTITFLKRFILVAITIKKTDKEMCENKAVAEYWQ